MLTLINSNFIVPPIAPVGLDYVGTAARTAGIETELVDLCLTDDAAGALKDYFSKHSLELVGITFRNVDDCFWPSGESFLPKLCETIKLVRDLSDAPIVLGGVGYSIFAERIVEHTGADFGIRGDGERAIVSLYEELRGKRDYERVPGLVWRRDDTICCNGPAWPEKISLPVTRDVVDNVTYFNRGGQIGIETKRGCNRQCIYCADFMAKGKSLRTRDPAEVADEVETLLAKGIDVLHICDSEFNVSRSHAIAVCEEMIRRSLGERVRWYVYMAVTPFDAEFAEKMKRAGCVGIDFTGDAGCGIMLKTYRQQHSKDDLARAVELCRANGITVMIDMLLGGPGETPETVKETIDFLKKIGPDCAGASLGIRIYPGTEMERIVASEGDPQSSPNILRKYDGPLDYLKPTYYISSALGQNPARLVKDLIDGDKRFFEPMEEVEGEATDHNYNDNSRLVAAIEAGARGAYWDILRGLAQK